jgi:hypothetical protein
MSGLARISVGEITLEKERFRSGGPATLSLASPEVQALLNGFSFMWAGG